MYQTFTVRGFRGFRDLEINDLARINLIGGKNNVGKTSLLEAFFLFANPHKGEIWTRLNAFRGLSRIQISTDTQRSTAFDSLFYQFDSNQEIQLAGRTDQQEYDFRLAVVKNSYDRAMVSLSSDVVLPIFQLSVQDKMQSDSVTEINFKVELGQLMVSSPSLEDRHPTYFFNSTIREGFEVVAERFSTLILEGQEALVVKALQAIEPRIQSARLLQRYGSVMVHVEIGDRKPTPIVLMGDGMNRFLQLVLAMGNARNGVILIDEIENGLHYSTHAKIWQILGEVAELFNVQVIATTHSSEMIESAYDAFHEQEDPTLFRYHRLARRKNGEITITTYSPDAIQSNFEMDFEVR